LQESYHGKKVIEVGLNNLNLIKKRINEVKIKEMKKTHENKKRERISANNTAAVLGKFDKYAGHAMKKAFTAVDKGVKKFTLPRQNIRKTLVDTKRKTLSGHMGLGLNDIKSLISEPKSGSIVEHLDLTKITTLPTI
jgi:hypothetical protein